MTDYNCNDDIHLFDFQKDTTSFELKTVSQFSQLANTIIKMYTEKTYNGPISRLMQALYQLRG